MSQKEAEAVNEDEDIDPRIKELLEELNKWTEEINKLEKWFEEGNMSFRCCLSEYSDKLKLVAERVGPKKVACARPFHEAKQRALAAQAECQRTVLGYDEACRLHVQAHDEIQCLEKRLLHSSGSDIDVASQEILNQLTMRLRAADLMKHQSKERHEARMKDFIAAEEEVQKLANCNRSAIRVSRYYFQEAEKFKQHMILIKQQVDMLTEKIRSSKLRYSVTLKELERISEEIHEKRNKRLPLRTHERIAGLNSDPFLDVERPACLSLHDCPVPDLDTRSPHLRVDSSTLNSLSHLSLCPVASDSYSCSSTCDHTPAEVSANMSQLSLSDFDEIELD